MKQKDIIQIGLNILAFLILFFAPGGHGSFWGFITFNIIAGVILLEILLSKDKTGQWIWITKTCTYILLCFKFSENMGVIRVEYIVMIIISVIALVISRRLIKERAVSMWGQNVAYIIGAYMYIMAIIHEPGSFGIAHALFWMVNWISYFLLIREVILDKKEKVNLIIPGYAVTMSFIYIVLILVT